MIPFWSKIKLPFLGFLLALLSACTKEYDFEKLSGQMLYNPAVDAPIVRGSLTAKDFFSGKDSLIKNNGDTVTLVFRDDSLFYFDLSEFSGIPPQDTDVYILESAYTYPILLVDSIIVDSVEIFSFSFENNMRLDSIFLNDGFIMVEVSSSFKHTGLLTITSPDVIMNGQPFQKKIQISSTDGMFYQKNLYPLQNAKIYVENTVAGEGFVRDSFHLVLYRNPGQGIQAGDRVQINFSYIDLDQFEAIFGFAGNDNYTKDTLLSLGLDKIEGVTGSFSVIDPRINITYANSFGVPIGIDLSILGNFNDGHTVFIDPPMEIIEASDDYQQPVKNGSLHFNRDNIPNIDEFLTFPPPESLFSGSEASANPGTGNAANFVLKNSNVQVGLEIEIPMAFRADLQLRDTFKLIVENTKAGDYVEYANLHYRFRNEFPVTLDPYIILYDSISDINLDTIYLTESLTDPFIPAAPVDENGITITSQVKEITGIIRLDESLIDNFFNVANKMIVVGSFSSYQKDIVIILTAYKFDFRCNLEAKIRLKTNFN
jgi:hypothetical protein